MEYEIKRFNIWSVVKIVFIIFLIMGFLISVFYLAILSIFQSFVQSIGIGGFEDEMATISGIASIFIVFFISISYAVFATIFSVLILGLYNIIAGIIGGFKFTLNKEFSETTEGKTQIQQP